MSDDVSPRTKYAHFEWSAKGEIRGIQPWNSITDVSATGAYRAGAKRAPRRNAMVWSAASAENNSPVWVAGTTQ